MPIGPIICVCTGNICRSPMAERLLARDLAAAGEPWSVIEVISAGVSAYDGQPASSYSVKALKELNLDLSDHRSQGLTRQMAESASLLLVMTQMHALAIEEDFENLKTPVMLWRELMPRDKQVTDPFGADYSTYKDCRDCLTEALPSLVEWIKANIKES